MLTRSMTTGALTGWPINDRVYLTTCLRKSVRTRVRSRLRACIRTREPAFVCACVRVCLCE